MIPLMLISGILWMPPEPITHDPWPVVVTQILSEDGE